MGVVSKAFQILAVVNKSFVNLDEFTLPLLYKTLIRPHLEYGNVIWDPHFKMDQKALEPYREGLPKWYPHSRTSCMKCG